MTLPRSLAHQPADIAISMLVEEHGGKLYHQALKFCGNPADAEEIGAAGLPTRIPKMEPIQG